MGYPPTPGAPGMEPPEAQSIRSMLHIARILAILVGILALLGGVVYAAWIVYLSTICSTYVGFDPYCGGAVGGALVGAIYLVLLGVVAIVVYLQMQSIEAKVNAHHYEAAKSQTLLWMILGLIFGIILGLVLLVAYIKFDPLITWQRNQMGGAPVAPGAYGAPPMVPPGVAAPMPAQKFCSACGSPNAPTAQFCAKCGAPMVR
jgi:hypothetical protein